MIEHDDHQCCNQLKYRVRNNYTKNMKKFCLYSDRNIFTFPKDSVEVVTSPTVQLDSNNNLKDTSNIIDEEVKSLREKFCTLSKSHEIVKLEYNITEKVAIDIKGALFGLRLGAQVIESHQMQPLAERIALLEHQKRNLVSLIDKAKGKKMYA